MGTKRLKAGFLRQYGQPLTMSRGATRNGVLKAAVLSPPVRSTVLLLGLLTTALATNRLPVPRAQALPLHR